MLQNRKQELSLQVSGSPETPITMKEAQMNNSTAGGYFLLSVVRKGARAALDAGDTAKAMIAVLRANHQFDFADELEDCFFTQALVYGQNSVHPTVIERRDYENTPLWTYSAEFGFSVCSTGRRWMVPIIGEKNSSGSISFERTMSAN